MKLRDIVEKDAILPVLAGSERDEVIVELVGALVQANVLTEDLRPAIVEAVLERERQGSTGFGKGIAIPHVKHDAVSKVTAAVGLSEPGVDFNALDKQPVYSVFLLVSPKSDPEGHLKAMEVIFHHLGSARFRSFLRQAQAHEEVWSLLKDADDGALA